MFLAMHLALYFAVVLGVQKGNFSSVYALLT